MRRKAFIDDNHSTCHDMTHLPTAQLTTKCAHSSSKRKRVCVHVRRSQESRPQMKWIMNDTNVSLRGKKNTKYRWPLILNGIEKIAVIRWKHVCSFRTLATTPRHQNKNQQTITWKMECRTVNFHFFLSWKKKQKSVCQYRCSSPSSFWPIIGLFMIQNDDDVWH